MMGELSSPFTTFLLCMYKKVSFHNYRICHFLALSLFMRSSVPLFLSVFFVSDFILLCICFLVSLCSPPRRPVPFLDHHTHPPFGPFPSLLQRLAPPITTHEYPVLFHLHLRSPSPVLPTLHPHSPTHTLTVFTTQFSPFPSQTHTTAPLSSLSPSTLTSNSLHQPHWDPNTRDQ